VDEGRCCDDCHEKVLKARLAKRELLARISGLTDERCIVVIDAECCRINVKNSFLVMFYGGRRSGEIFPKQVLADMTRLADSSKVLDIFTMLLDLSSYGFIMVDFDGVFLEGGWLVASTLSEDLKQMCIESAKIELVQQREQERKAQAEASAEQREQERKAQAKADEAYLAEERKKATAEKKAHKEAMELKKQQGTSLIQLTSPHITSTYLNPLTLRHFTHHTDDEAKAKAEKAKEDFANSPEGKAHAKDIQDKEAEIAARERKKKDEERAEDLARLAQLRKEKKEEEAKAKAEEEKKRKSGGKFRREDPEDDDSGAGGGGGGGGGKSKKGKKN